LFVIFRKFPVKQKFGFPAACEAGSARHILTHGQIFEIATIAGKTEQEFERRR
jgi:hypothetical protein